ncbi:MAG: phosphate ABC transporter substrate-binding protein PstS [Firmicutes bacterium]|nr:phosphate ABC transporter substrate-binding protein PstS [Bacillota bacterium]
MRVFNRKTGILLSGGVLFAALLAGCGSGNGGNTAGNASTGTSPQQSSTPQSSTGATVNLTGAGSTFDNPLFSAMFPDYERAHPNVKINYQSIGSGGGIQALTNKEVDFGASDAPLKPDQEQAVGGADAVVHIPVTIGPAAIFYNLPGVDKLQLDGTTLTKIFAGKITKWNDPAIAADNPGVKLPSNNIVVAHRSDGSGTTSIITHYFAAVDPQDWPESNASTSPDWHNVGVGAKGTEGVASTVRSTKYSIGYGELSYAKQSNMPVVWVKNKAGKFVEPTVEAASAAAAQFQLPADGKIYIVNADGADSYPITGFSWVIVYTKQTDATKGKELVNLLKWMITDGQSKAASLYYAPLPDSVQQFGLHQLQKITGPDGQPLLQQ